MPGIVGFFLNEIAAIDCTSLIKKMAASLSQNKDHHTTLYVAPEKGLGLARVGYLFENLDTRKGNLDNKDEAFLFDGELYEDEHYSDPEFIQQCIREKGLTVLSDLRGLFNIVYFENGPSRLFIITDKFGLRPIYYTIIPQGILFSSEIKALLVFEEIRREVDIKALAEFFYYGHLLGNRTPFKGIKLLPPGSVCTCSHKEAPKVSTYWHLTDLFVPQDEYEDLPIDKIVSAFGEAVMKRTNFKNQLALSLSGGLDSRAILAVLGNKAIGMPSYTVGLKGCQDERYSAEMADICGLQHTFVKITEEHLKEFEALAETLVFLSDGMYHPHEST